jgi:hypothetical protein
MSYEMKVYKDYTKYHRLDILNIMPDIIDGNRVYGLLDDSITFDRVKDISRLIKHLLLNTNYFFEIKRVTEEPRGYFVK